MSDKPRLVQVPESAELETLLAADGHLGSPMPIHGTFGIYFDADELRAWRSQQAADELVQEGQDMGGYEHTSKGGE